jgi:uncharacterized protein (DUF885 family)
MPKQPDAVRDSAAHPLIAPSLVVMLMIAVMLVTGCSTSRPTTALIPQFENRIAETLFERSFLDRVNHRPQLETELGLPGDHTQWNDTSYDHARSMDIAETENWQQLAASVNLNLLTAANRLSYRVAEFNEEIRRDTHQFWLHDYRLAEGQGVQSQILSFLIEHHPERGPDDLPSFITRLHNIKPYVAAHIDLLSQQRAKGIRPPDFLLRKILASCSGQTDGAPFTSSPHDAPLRAEFIRRLQQQHLPEEDAAAMTREADAALLDSVGPANRLLCERLEASRDASDTDAGVWRLPDGDLFYAHRLHLATTTRMTADEIHVLGIKEIARWRAELAPLLKAAALPDDLRAARSQLQKNADSFLANDEDGRQAYLSHATAHVMRVNDRLATLLHSRPDSDLVILPIEATRHAGASKAMYSAATASLDRPAHFRVNFSDLGMMPLWELPALTYHYTMPGRHLQAAVTQQLDLPRFRRHAHFRAFEEGWARYAEHLAGEVGLYADKLSRIGYVARKLTSAALLVVDTGIHHHRWSREQAIDYLLDNTLATPIDAETQVNVAAAAPGDGVAGHIGYLRVLALRELSRTTLGSGFDVREFHHQILSHGPLPLPLLQAEVETWLGI